LSPGDRFAGTPAGIRIGMAFRRWNRIIAGALLALTSVCAAVPGEGGGPTPQQTPRLDPCSAIPVELTDTLDTATVRTGDIFHFRTIDTIVPIDNVKVPRYATGYGLVAFASPAGAHGKSGSLIIEARYVNVPGHGQYQVAIDSVATSAVLDGRSGNVASGVGLLPLPFVGTAVGAFNYLHAGKNAVVAAGTRFVVVPVGNLKTRARCAL
jgi:hypothetical protein